MSHLLSDHPDWPNAMTTPTPRSDAALCRYTGGECVTFPAGIAYVVPYRFAQELERELAAAQERVEDLEVRCANAEARAENWHKVADSRSAELIKQMARAEASERDAKRYRKCRRNGGFFFTSDCMTDDEVDAEIDALPDHAAIAEGKK